ncbi:MAG: class I SAM-dependent methyltransferase [Erysipelotrichales bacterium]|nr:class I SAM-dependent methyltransferase [Erysipelotrichales bacterium]
MRIINNLDDYEILDMANGQKLERWNEVILSRPDPQIIWGVKSRPSLWDSADAMYKRSHTGGGEWYIYNKDMPTSWCVSWEDLTFNLKLMGFKHTGLFPEQSYNWNIIRKKIIAEGDIREVKVLNLFAYTGGASVAALSAGASVVHVDSSRGIVDWAKENVRSSNLDDRPIRYIVDDVVKFVEREIRRGNKYDIIIMDPPSFGRGSNKEIWNIETDLFNLVKLCTELLSDDPIMFLINSYTTGLSMNVLSNILKLTVSKKYDGFIDCDEVGIKMKDSNLVLPCGIFARWERDKYED